MSQPGGGQEAARAGGVRAPLCSEVRQPRAQLHRRCRTSPSPCGALGRGEDRGGTPPQSHAPLCPPCPCAAAPTTGPRHLTPPPLPGPDTQPQSDFPNYSTRAAPAPSTRPRGQVFWVLGLPGGCWWSGSRRRGSSGARLLCKSCKSALPPRQAPGTAWLAARRHVEHAPSCTAGAGSIPHGGSVGQPCVCPAQASDVKRDASLASLHPTAPAPGESVPDLGWAGTAWGTRCPLPHSPREPRGTDPAATGLSPTQMLPQPNWQGALRPPSS